MELKSSINETWKLFSLGTFVGCLLILLILDKSHQNTSLLAARNAMLQFGPFKMLDSPTDEIINTLDPSNFTTTNPIDVSNATALAPTMNDQVIAVENVTTPMNQTEKKCNMFDGQWVYNPDETPTYDSIKCPFLEEKISCRVNGRPDFEYEKWRWEANNCDIPLFNGTDMLERLRNKSMVISGDSLNRNMWESLACLLYTSIPSSRVEVHANQVLYKVLKAKDYNFTFEFYWSPFLVDFDTKHKSGKNVLVLDKLSPNSKHWLGADIMVFNSGHWWSHTGKMKSWDLFEYKGELTEEMPLELAYERAMRTWATWIENNVDSTKTVYFRSISAEHKSRQYNQWCYNVTKPIIDESYVSVYPESLVDTIETMINGMNNPKVNYLNITKLSSYRMDAHPSVYRSMDWKNITKKFENVLGYADCSHWCLPGLPDTWNRLLYTSLFYNISDITSS
ncbi:protein PMR5-like [Chenopodium quinoa]|uniref:protein PMR5-like n=1 Tax=Chenopodium quinoa TaxID=63459 RepID=UPI000B79A04D|nr:protein PMR5-like [Chenopodium quinoa]